MRVVAVFDTNVLFSGVGWAGTPRRCLDLARTGVVHAATCREIIEELAEKLETKLNLVAESIDSTIADLLVFHEVVTIRGWTKAVPDDPDDDKVIECAMIARATHIVTGDKRHLLPLGSYQGIAIVTLAQFLAASAAL